MQVNWWNSIINKPTVVVSALAVALFLAVNSPPACLIFAAAVAFTTVLYRVRVDRHRVYRLLRITAELAAEKPFAARSRRRKRRAIRREAQRQRRARRSAEAARR